MPTFNDGPLRCELTGLYEARYWFGKEERGSRPSEMQLRWRISGKRITKIVRHGPVILTEAVDDTGKSLIGPDTYTDEERNALNPLRVPPSRLRFTGLEKVSRLEPPARGAKSITLHGTARLVLAKEREQITIDRPLDYVGKTLEHDRLKELGIEIKVIPPADVDARAADPAKRYVLQYVKGKNLVFDATLLDAWMKPMRWQSKPMKTKQGEDVDMYMLAQGKLTDDCQLVLEVLPEIEEKTLPIEIDNMPLP